MVDVEPVARRVKLYQLNKDGQWDDGGTGHVDYMFEDSALILTVTSEDSDSNYPPLLTHKIQACIEYQRQGETIIMWCEPETNEDVALSFQQDTHCTEVWEQISATQQRLADAVASDLDDSMGLDAPLPQCSIKNLDEICQRILNPAAHMRISLAITVRNSGYIDGLLDIFNQIVDLDVKESLPSLHTMFHIFKGLIMLSDDTILSMLLSDDYFPKLLAVLEYDPELPPGSYTRHRSFFERSNFKQCVDINNPEVLSKIHQNFHITYLKDVILLKYLDDTTQSTLAQFIYQNNALIITRLGEDENFLNNLFQQLEALAPLSSPSSDQKDDDHRRNVFLFLQELCNIPKVIALTYRNQFYHILTEYKLLKYLEIALLSGGPRKQYWLWLCVSDIINSLVVHSPDLLRSYILETLSTPPNRTLLSCLFNALISPSVQSGLAHQLAHIIERLLDPTTLATMQPNHHKENFLTHIYTFQVPKLAFALDFPNHETAKKMSKRGLNSCLFHALELLSYCTQHHATFVKRVFLSREVLRKAALLIPQMEPMVICAAIRLIRRVIALEDPAFLSQVVQYKILDPIIEVFIANGARYNMLNSVILDLMKLIREQNLRSLVEYVVVHHDEKVSHIEYVNTFRRLRACHTENMKTRESLEANPADPSEYHYFEAASDSENDIPSDAVHGSDDSDLDEKFLEMAAAHSLKRKMEEDEGDILRALGKKKQKQGGTEGTATSQAFLQFRNR
jgi:protein phosphatase-4 regulatory subunit 3